MRRSLVLTQENARHPFRAMLPPSVNHNAQPRSTPKKVAWLTRDDVRGVADAYVAAFVAVLAFIM